MTRPQIRHVLRVERTCLGIVRCPLLVFSPRATLSLLCRNSSGCFPNPNSHIPGNLIIVSTVRSQPLTLREPPNHRQAAEGTHCVTSGPTECSHRVRMLADGVSHIVVKIGCRCNVPAFAPLFHTEVHISCVYLVHVGILITLLVPCLTGPLHLFPSIRLQYAQDLSLSFSGTAIMSARGLTAKGVPSQPRWLLYLKIAILVLSLVVLALAAYSISLFGSYYGLVGGTGAGGFLIFVVGLPYPLPP